MFGFKTPRGFRKAGDSGLLVPAGVERRREVWGPDERKAMDRAARVTLLHGIKLTLSCVRTGCRGSLERVEDDTGQYVLRCDCTDRVMARNL